LTPVNHPRVPSEQTLGLSPIYPHYGYRLPPHSGYDSENPQALLPSLRKAFSASRLPPPHLGDDSTELFLPIGVWMPFPFLFSRQFFSSPGFQGRCVYPHLITLTVPHGSVICNLKTDPETYNARFSRRACMISTFAFLLSLISSWAKTHHCLERCSPGPWDQSLISGVRIRTSSSHHACLKPLGRYLFQSFCFRCTC